MKNNNGLGGKKGLKISMPVLMIVFLGFIVAIGIYQYASKDMVEILVPSEKIESRTQVEAGDFVVKTVSKDSVPSDAYVAGQEAELEGKITATALLPDLPVVPGHFLGKDVKSSLTSAAPEGKVLVTLSMDNIRAVSSKISPQDKVNVYSSMQSDVIGTLTKLVFQNVQVVDVAQGEQGINAVTLAISPEEAEELVYAQQVGEIHLAVVPYDYKEITTNGISDLQFIEKHINNGTIPVGDHLSPPGEDKEKENEE